MQKSILITFLMTMLTSCAWTEVSTKTSEEEMKVPEYSVEFEFINGLEDLHVIVKDISIEYPTTDGKGKTTVFQNEEGKRLKFLDSIQKQITITDCVYARKWNKYDYPDATKHSFVTMTLKIVMPENEISIIDYNFPVYCPLELDSLSPEPIDITFSLETRNDFIAFVNGQPSTILNPINFNASVESWKEGGNIIVE